MQNAAQDRNSCARLILQKIGALPKAARNGVACCVEHKRDHAWDLEPPLFGVLRWSHCEKGAAAFTSCSLLEANVHVAPTDVTYPTVSSMVQVLLVQCARV